MQFLRAWLLRSAGEDRRAVPAEGVEDGDARLASRQVELPDILDRFLQPCSANVVILDHHRRGRE